METFKQPPYRGESRNCNDLKTGLTETPGGSKIKEIRRSVGNKLVQRVTETPDGTRISEGFNGVGAVVTRHPGGTKTTDINGITEFLED